MAKKQGCGSKLLGGIVLIGLTCWGINGCVEQDATESKQLVEETLRRNEPSALSPQTDKTDPIVPVNAVTLCKAYLSDPDKAARKYRGKTVLLRGTVGYTGCHPEDGPFAALATTRKTFVICAWFDKKHEKAVLALPKGLTVHVRGKVGDVGVDKKRGEVFLTLDECMLVEAQ